VLFFVHGFNNDMASVITRAQALERRYPVEVIAFTWPANGGVLSYKSDKRDARASAGALERTISKMQRYLQALTETERNKCWAASKKYPEDMGVRDAWYAHSLGKESPCTVNMMAHSKGNYVLKQALKPSLSEASRILFNNIVLVAADTNNHDHALWVDRLQCRGRIFVAINERTTRWPRPA
jgi:esterase/lipase superfamily enzyme